MRLGAHVSIADGLSEAVDYGLSVGCECIQVFAKSPQQWKGPATDPHLAAAFAAYAADKDLQVFTHTAYLINLASPDPHMQGKSIEALADELRRAELLGARGCVTHVGASLDGDRDAAAERVAYGVARAVELASSAPRTRLLLENTAGAGTTFGATFEELGRVVGMAGLPSERLGVCLDTCHAFAYGYPLDADAGWEDLVAEIRAELGLERLGLVHANDSKFERGSARDRHEWVGDGFIGRQGFEAMLRREELSDVCAIIEMAGEKPYKDEENLRRLASLRELVAQNG